ncbi:SusD/RagB family nutrient-binding outer membrane lipoprotein [Sphingobacterium haloxyli]|uniref:SusD/RagB family nutrient-binding outer membrane lipoprotein n=2 Tax=Sphingobacterium haloxyli TaxID=2100533 RepID=A0A2S9J0Z4_9SPHI|nr:SusD/RagB family nutrient-binding outer membrane lipoprotein [Sphingobacterium haloxyli]
MKCIMKKTKYFIIAAVAVFVTSCSKHFDINDNPNDPLALSEDVLLPRIQKYLAYGLSMGSDTDENGVSKGGFGTNLSAYTHQMTHYGNADQYGALPNDYFWDAGWSLLYRDVLTNTEFIINQGTENGNPRYVGIAKIIKAYAYSVLVDLFGEVPFSEANQLTTNQIRYPKYDKGEDIYPQLFTLLDEAIVNLQSTSAENEIVPGADDVIYGGNMARWIKAANSIKLKLLVQQRKVKDVSSEVNALISSGDLISSTAESFMVPFGINSATDDRNPAFSQYYATQRTMSPSPWLYEIMKGYNNNILTGIEDPRIPYYFYNQMTEDDAPSDIVEYRDGGFVSIYFGSQGPNRSKNSQNVISLFGIYPVGGRYDTGAGGTASASSGTGAAPYRMITYADILFLQAELAQEGLISGNAGELLEKAISETSKMIDYVVANNQSSQSVPVLSGSDEEDDYISAVMAQFTSASNDKKLEHIMTQKWLSSIGSWVDQYNDYRRTGYPVLFNPADFGGIVTPPAGGNGGDDIAPVRVVLNRPFPLSLPFIADEINKNTNAPAQKGNLGTAKVFWMP